MWRWRCCHKIYLCTFTFQKHIDCAVWRGVDDSSILICTHSHTHTPLETTSMAKLQTHISVLSWCNGNGVECVWTLLDALKFNSTHTPMCPCEGVHVNTAQPGVCVFMYILRWLFYLVVRQCAVISKFENYYRFAEDGSGSLLLARSLHINLLELNLMFCIHRYSILELSIECICLSVAATPFVSTCIIAKNWNYDSQWILREGKKLSLFRSKGKTISKEFIDEFV